MLVDPATLSASAMYRFMIGVIVPRPIAFVSTVGADGRFNVAPFSFFNGISTDLPLVGVAIGARAGAPKDTLRNVRATGDFVVNIVDEPLLARAVRASGDWPPEVSEFDLTGLTPEPAERVRSPRVAESPVSLECRLEREIPFGSTSLVVGRIACARVLERVLTEGRVDIEKLRPAGRLGGDGYSIVRDVIHIARPQVGRGAGAADAGGGA